MFHNSSRFTSNSNQQAPRAGYVRLPLILALALVPLAALGFALSAKTASPTSACLQEIAMGSAEMKGGTTKIGEIDPAVVQSGGTTSASGEVCNKMAITITDYDVSLKKATTTAGNTKIQLKGATNAATFDANGVAHFDYAANEGLTGNNCVSYKISGLIADGSGANILVNVTPSAKQSLGGSVVECNMLPPYSLSSMSDMARNGISEMYHSCALATVSNADGTSDLTAVSGTVALLDVTQALTNVYFVEVNGTPIPNATISITGNQFTISGFAAIGPEKTVMVAMKFADPVGGTRMQALLQGTFSQ